MFGICCNNTSFPSCRTLTFTGHTDQVATWDMISDHHVAAESTNRLHACLYSHCNPHTVVDPDRSNLLLHSQSSQLLIMDERRVMLPAGVSPGVIIGKGGSNIKSLNSRSIGFFIVQQDHVRITGTHTEVEAGEAALQLQFKSYKTGA